MKYITVKFELTIDEHIEFVGAVYAVDKYNHRRELDFYDSMEDSQNL